MYNQSGRFLRLFGNIFFSLIGIIVLVALIMLALRLISSGFDAIPWFTYFYMCIVLLIPPTLFGTVHIIFFRKTKYHPSTWVKYISYFLFTPLLISWAVILIIDFKEFFTNHYPDIERYYAFNLLILFINVAVVFFIGVLQALTTEKEKDWMERRKQFEN